MGKGALSLEGNMVFAEQETDSQRMRKSSSFLAPFRASFPFQKYKGKYNIFTAIFLHVFQGENLAAGEVWPISLRRCPTVPDFS